MKMTSRSYQEESLSSVGLHMIFAIVSFCCWLVCIFSVFYNEMCCFYKEEIKFKLEMEKTNKQTNLGIEYDKAVHCNLAYLTYMHRTSFKMVDWMNLKLKSIFQGEISTTSDMEIIPL